MLLGKDYREEINVALTDISSLLDTLGQNFAGYDYQANRLRNDHANRLREIAGMGLRTRKGLADSLASNGMIHSGVNLEAQNDLMMQEDQQRANASQQLNDRLADIARKKIQSETQFNITSMLPR
jgi:hypothetical protein